MTTTATSSQAPADVLRDLWSAAGGDPSALVLRTAHRKRARAALLVSRRNSRAGHHRRCRPRRRRGLAPAHEAQPDGFRRHAACGDRVPQRALHAHRRQAAGTRLGQDRRRLFDTGDGRKVRLHTNFPHHRDGMLKLLGCGLRARGGAGGAAPMGGREVRNRRRRSGPGRHHDALARRVGRAPAGAGGGRACPLFEITKIGEAPARPLPASPRKTRAPARRRPRARSDAGDRRPGVRADARRPRRRRHAHHCAAPAGPRQLDIDTGRGKLSANVDLRATDDRDWLRALVRRGARVRAGLSPGRCCGTRVLARGAAPRCGPASSRCRCRPTATRVHGRPAAASTRWCRTPAASTLRRPKPPASPRPRNCPRRRSITRRAT